MFSSCCRVPSIAGRDGRRGAGGKKVRENFKASQVIPRFFPGFQLIFPGL